MNPITFFLVLLSAALIAALLIVRRSQNQINQLKTLLNDQKSKREEFALSMYKVNENVKKNLAKNEAALVERKNFDECFSTLIIQSKKFSKIFAVALINVNQLTNIDTTLVENNKGDLLTQISRRLKKSIRDTDVACCGENGDFLVLLPNIMKPEIVVHAVERIIQNISPPAIIVEKKIDIDACIGISIYPFDGETQSQLLQNARVALDKAKQSGNNVFQFYQEETHLLGDRELALKSAIKSEAFLERVKLVYKPYFDATKNVIACIDVTSTYIHPELGEISFDELIRISQSASRLYDLYEWMIKSAINKFATLNNNQPHEKNRFIFTFNLKQFESPFFLNKITEIIKQLSSDKNEIIMAIKDDGIEDINMELLKDSIIKLNTSKIPLSIGILVLGHFAIRKMDHVTFNYLKIDEKLITDLNDRQESQLILAKIMSLATNLKIGTMTAGVDTQEKKFILENLGCTIMQGKLFDNANSTITEA